MIFDEIKFQRQLYDSILAIFKDNLTDHWGWELSMRRTAEAINRPVFYVRRIIERERERDAA